MGILGKITEFRKNAHRQWLQTREGVAWAQFAPGEVGPGALFPSLPAAELAPEGLRSMILSEAEEILRGKFSVCQGLTLSVHTPPIWYRDYLAGQEAPTTARAMTLDVAKLPGHMDARMVWELNRWTQLVRLAQAFYLSRDEHFREILLGWLEDWNLKNPIGQGWNWTRVSEASLRLINLTWIDALCGLPETLVGKLLPGHVWWLQRYHEVGFAPEESRLAPLGALLCAVARWPQAAAWSQPLAGLCEHFQAELLQEFTLDGLHVSQALDYHLRAWEICGHAQRAVTVRGLRWDADAQNRWLLAGEVGAVMLRGAEVWPCGDCENAQLTPLAAGGATSWQEWREWWQGAENALTYWAGEAPKREQSPSLTQFQLFSKEEWLLQWKLTTPTPQAHSHQDSLHCSIWQDGLAVMIDPGTGDYGPGRSVRVQLASAAAHNGPHGLAVKASPRPQREFGWDPITSTLEHAGDTAILTLGRHRFQRTITALERGWRIRDESAAPFAVHWQLAPGWEVEPHDDYFLLFRAGHSLRLQIRGAEVICSVQPCAPSYGQRLTATQIAARAAAGGCILTELTAERLL